MHDADDDHALGVRDEEHHVRESTQQGAPHARPDFSIPLRNPCDCGEGCIARPHEFGTESWLALLVPSKRRVHFERGGGEYGEREWPKVHLGTVELVLKNAFAHLFPAEGAFAALVKVFDAPIKLCEKFGRQRDVRRGRFDGDRVPEVLNELEALRN